MARSFSHYFAVVVAGTLLGAIVLGLFSFLIAFLLVKMMMQTYIRHAPSDGPFYVGLGLVILGVLAGAIFGFIVSLTISIRRASKNKTLPNHQQPILL